MPSGGDPQKNRSGGKSCKSGKLRSDSTFLAPISDHIHWLASSALAFTLSAFLAISTWALGGVAVKIKLNKDSFRKFINATLFVLLIYTAIEAIRDFSVARFFIFYLSPQNLKLSTIRIFFLTFRSNDLIIMSFDIFIRTIDLKRVVL